MMCAWKQLLAILPPWLRAETDVLGKDSLRELRLRVNGPPELNLAGKIHWLRRTVTREDISFCINAASGYSPWAAATMARGYLTAPGGHRIGLCGEAVFREGEVTGLREIHSLCIRVARDFPGIAGTVRTAGSVLVLGAPGWGKTTLLRDLVRQIGEREPITVVDERGEVFPEGLPQGKRTDILTGTPKASGIDMALRTMSPRYIAVDEITEPRDCQAILQAVGCGVCFLATAHGASKKDLLSRPVYKPLLENRVFQTLVLLKRDQTFTTERMEEWISSGSARCS